MKIVEQTSQKYFKELRILHLALLVGQVLISGILYSMTIGEKRTTGLDFSDIYSFIVPGAIVFGFVASSIVFKRLVEKAKEEKDLKDKLGAYRGASIAKWGLLEGSTMIALILFFISGNLTFLMMGGAMIAYFASTGSSIDKTIEDLALNRDEQIRVRRDDEIVARIKTK